MRVEHGVTNLMAPLCSKCSLLAVVTFQEIIHSSCDYRNAIM